MFVLKKIIGFFLMPVPLGLGLITLGLLLVLLRRRTRGWCALLAGWVILLVASNRGLSLALTASLENTFPPCPALSTEGIEADTEALAAVAFVAVLGGGHGDALALPAGQRLSPSARARLVEGVRIARALPSTWLVVCGARNDRHGAELPTHARVLADAAVELGFPRERIVEIDNARDTAEETTAIALFAGSEVVALVTSAWHLPRAMKLATGAGVRAFPCPADYLGGRDAQIDAGAWFTWEADSLLNTSRAWREYLGQVWAAANSP